jgi:predicted porin
MNKLLLGTTALVGASLLLAGPVDAAKPKVKVNGGIVIELGGSTQDLESFQDSAGSSSAGPLRGYAINTSSEVHINVSGKTDAGMKWKARVEFETDTNVASQAKESAIDELWIKFSGSWGQIHLGNEDGAEDLMHFSGEQAVKKAGAGGVDGHWDDFVGWREVNKRFAHEPTLKEDSSDGTKISYYTPRVGGLQLGVSFTPDTGAAGQAFTTDNNADFENTWGLGVNYKKKFGGVKVGIAGVAHIGEAEPEGPNDDTLEDLRAWMVGFNLEYGNWKFGAGYQDNGDGGQAKSTVGDDDSRAWDVGLGYAAGPLHLGVSWLHAEVDDPGGADANDKDEGDTVNVGATYMLGGGARVYAEVFWFDTESGDSHPTNNDGFGFILGTGVKF